MYYTVLDTSFVHPFIHSFIRSFVRSFACLFVHFIAPWICLPSEAFWASTKAHFKIGINFNFIIRKSISQPSTKLLLFILCSLHYVHYNIWTGCLFRKIKIDHATSIQWSWKSINRDINYFQWKRNQCICEESQNVTGLEWFYQNVQILVLCLPIGFRWSSPKVFPNQNISTWLPRRSGRCGSQRRLPKPLRSHVTSDLPPGGVVFFGERFRH